VPVLDLKRLASHAAVIVKQPSEYDGPACFQSEFMANIQEYSQSWREAALRENRTLE